MEFVAIDVETANPDMSSICQIGLVQVRNGAIQSEWKSLINPKTYFHPTNVSIHGIEKEDVESAPTFFEIAPELYSRMKGTVAACHTLFDRTSIQRTATRFELQAPDCIWLDTAKIARRVWPEWSKKGFGLRALCDMLGFEFRHHDALQDAKACAHILVEAAKVTNIDLGALRAGLKRPADLIPTSSIRQDGNPDGPLYGEILVFTGALQIPRREAAAIAASVGCKVVNGVSRKVTLLVVGDQDILILDGHQKSNKHRKAEELIAQGVAIQILGESDFAEMVRLAQE